MCLVSFLCTGMTNDIFYCFGTSDNVREQLKISDKGNINTTIAFLIKYGGIFSGVLIILPFKWLICFLMS